MRYGAAMSNKEVFMHDRLDPLEDLVGTLFIDRQVELEMYWRWANSVPSGPLNSYALVGRRRTGKTALLVKLFNRLFHEQTRVTLVFITFAQYLQRQEPISFYD